MLSLSRFCIRGLKGVYLSNSSFISKRIIHNSVQKQPKNVWSIQRIFHRLGTISPISSITAQSASQPLRFASVKCKKYNKVVGSWLLICGGMVFVAVALGGITRLTQSGLSMVTWRFIGEQMPTTHVQWLTEFEKYKQYPEYKISNNEMTLDEFKRIWWMEYLHRMWGRLIGVTFVMPASYFWMKGMLQPKMKVKIVLLGALIGLQGLIGWYMVKSGLEDRFHNSSDVPRVSVSRLATHLGLALAIYTGFLYNALDHLLPGKLMNIDLFGEEKLTIKISGGLLRFKKFVYATKGMIFLTAISGAFVAGLHGGLIYNTFPKMANKWIPSDLFTLSPISKNFIENPTTTQFNHRVLAISTLTLITVVGFMSRKLKIPGRGSKAVIAVVCAGYLQVVLGITALLNHVPIHLAALHQSGSLLLLSSIIWLCHELKHVRKLIK